MDSTKVQWMPVHAETILTIWMTASSLLSKGHSLIDRFEKWTDAHLNLLKVGAVPAVRQSGTRPFPVLQEGNSPQRHEDAEEDCASIVKKYANLNTHTHTEVHVEMVNNYT